MQQVPACDVLTSATKVVYCARVATLSNLLPD